MERKTLKQDQIDALFSGPAQAVTDAPAEEKTVTRWDFGQASQLSNEHVRAVSTLHESFVRRLSTSLGAYLRAGFEMNLVASEKLTFEDYLAPLGEMTYFASLQAIPIGAQAVLQVDLALVYPIVELVLGGRGEPIELRDLTEVEEQIFEMVVRLIARDLQTTWAPILQMGIQFEHRLHLAQVQGLMLPMEKVLALYFEIRLPEASGSLSLAFPPAVANALLRKLSMNAYHSDRSPSLETQHSLRERVMGCEFVADLNLPLNPLPVRDIIALQPGRILTSSRRAHEPIQLSVAGKPAFLAFPVCNGKQRAARVLQRLSLLPQNGKEAK